MDRTPPIIFNKQIDNDPRWREWLLLPHELSNRARQQHLNEAIAAADAARVISFFRGFLRENAAAPQQASSAMPAGKRSYTRADITRYSDLYRRGRFPEAEYQRLSADIHAAIADGRIVGPMPMRGIGKTRV
jgi:hypothetical protein